ncbi:MAG TPA: hypothetical protein ENK05_08120 [Gammaproteobacteria bacterium]|nr:hypothetical protein [Gammaproteobacteria bacterium]
MEGILQEVVDIVRADPHGGPALGLYALVSTLKMDRSGHLYMLRKLRELSPEHRRLAYGLMELMARGDNRGEQWEAAVAAMDEAIRKG